MASSMKSIKSRAPSCTCPEGCGFFFAARDLHVVCLAFLGPEHAKTDITDTCQTRARRTKKIRLFPKWSLSPGYPTGIDEWQMAAGCETLHEACPSSGEPVGHWLAFSCCMDDLIKYWERPLSSRVPVYGFSSLDMAGMQDIGWSNMLPMEALLAGHLNPRLDYLW